MGVIAIVIFVIAIKKLYTWFQRKITKPTFVDKTVWITGASSGIGKQLAIDFSGLGASLVISSRKVEELEKVKKECAHPDRVTIVPIDMSKTKELMETTTKFLKSLEEKGKKIDIVIENAGVSMRTEFRDCDYESHEYLTNLNYNGPVAHLKALLPHFISNKIGHIVAINSIAGLLAPAMRTSYCGSKHALRGFLDSLRSEVKDDNIDVTTIYPGYVQTDVSKNALGGKSGVTFGKIDKNIQEGETVESFSLKAIHGIFKKEKDVIITSQLKHELGVALRNLSFNLVHYLTYKNLKSQKEALKKAI